MTTGITTSRERFYSEKKTQAQKEMTEYKVYLELQRKWNEQVKYFRRIEKAGK